MGTGYYLHNWESFNVSSDRLAGTSDNFRGLTWPLDLDPRAGPQFFSRVGG